MTRSIERLREWIALPTIANMGINHREGAEYMRQLALDAGFQQARIVQTDGVPGVFATLDAGAKDTLAIYFMYDVKHYDPAEWIVAAAGRADRRPAGRGQGDDRPRRGQPEGAGDGLPGRAARVQGAGRQAAGQPGAGRRRRGGDRLAQLPADRRRPRGRGGAEEAVGIIIPSAGQAVDGRRRIDLGAKGAVELQLISSGEKWGRGPSKDIHSSLMASVDSPAWQLVKALDTLVAEDGHTPAIDGWFENVKPLTARQKELIAADVAAGNEADDMKALGIKHWNKDEDYLTSLATGWRRSRRSTSRAWSAAIWGRAARPSCRAAPRPRSTSGWCPT